MLFLCGYNLYVFCDLCILEVVHGSVPYTVFSLAVMSVSGQSDHFEASFNIVGPSDIKMEDNGDELGDITNMVVDGVATGSDADKRMVVDGPASGSDGNTVVSAVATPQSGSPAGDGVSLAPTLHAGLPEAPTPPLGNNWLNLHESAPQWFSSALYEAVQAAVTHSMHNVAIPLIEQTVRTALKRSREESSSHWNNGGGGPGAWHANKKKNFGGAWNSPPSFFMLQFVMARYDLRKVLWLLH